MNLNDIANRIQDARRTARVAPLGRRATRQLANDAAALLTALNAVLTLHRPDAYGICEICRDGLESLEAGAPCPRASVPRGLTPFVVVGDG